MGTGAAALTQRWPESRAGRYATFQIGGRYFAIESGRVRAILAAKDIRAKPPGSAIRGTVTLSGSDVAVIHRPAELGISVANGNTGEWVLVVESGTRTFGLEVDAIGDLIDVRDRDIRDGTIQLRMNGRAYGRAKTLFDPDDL